MARTKKNANKRKNGKARPLPTTKTRSSSSNNKKAKQKTNVAIESLTKKDRLARDMILEPIIERILAEEQLNKLINGRPIYGKIKETVEKYKSILPWLSTELLKKRVQRRRVKLMKSKNELADLTTPTPFPDQSLTQPHTSNSDDVHSISTITITTDDPTIVSISSCSDTSSTYHDTTSTRK